MYIKRTLAFNDVKHCKWYFKDRAKEIVTGGIMHVQYVMSIKLGKFSNQPINDISVHLYCLECAIVNL